MNQQDLDFFGRVRAASCGLASGGLDRDNDLSEQKRAGRVGEGEGEYISRGVLVAVLTVETAHLQIAD